MSRSEKVWTKSSRSTADGNCVEVRLAEPGEIQVRDSKRLNGPTLTFTSNEWSIFVGKIKDQQFDALGPAYPDLQGQRACAFATA